MTRNELWVILGVAAVLGGIVLESRFHADDRFADLRHEVRENRIEAKGDIEALRKDIAAIREDISELNTRVSRIEGKLDKPSPRPENIDPRLVQAPIERLEQEGFRRAAPPDATGR